jgi:hypothetical protein
LNIFAPAAFTRSVENIFANYGAPQAGHIFPHNTKARRHNLFKLGVLAYYMPNTNLTDLTAQIETIKLAKS